MRRRGRTLVVAWLVTSLAACGGSASTPAPTPSPTSTTDGAAEEAIDLVLLADSGGGGVAERYAAKASEALGREVWVHDRSLAGINAVEILERLGWAGYADDVAEAEIVVFYVHPNGGPASFETCFAAVEAVAGNPDYAGPTWAPGQTWDPPATGSAEDWQGYRDALDLVYDEIWRLRAGQPTILRGYGAWMPWISQWRQTGIASACVAMEEAADAVRREVAESHGAVYVSMLDVFNGPGHDADPVVKGLISEDGMHLNEAGQVVLVDALAAVGFEMSEPPR